MNNQGELLLPTPVQIQLQIYSALYYPKLRLAPLADGGIILAWEVRNDNTHSELRAIRLDSDFNSLWGPNGVQIASGDTQNWVFRELNLSVTDTGAAWLCWNESLNDEVSYNLKAQYLSPAGDLPWGWAESPSTPETPCSAALWRRLLRTAACSSGQTSAI